MYSVKKLEVIHLPDIMEFCKSAEIAGFQNNISPEKMKFNGTYDLRTVPAFWGLYDKDKIISVSGCHLWPGPKDDGEFKILRSLFRSATLPEYNIIPGISKNHMNSVPFSILLPYQIRWGKQHGCDDVFITTSHGEHDASGKMKRTHRALEILESRGIVTFFEQKTLYSTPQTVWKLVPEKYHDALTAFHSTRERLQIALDEEYYSIISTGF